MGGQKKKQLLPTARLSQQARRVAESRCAELGERLTAARVAAYAELMASDGALTAYELIASLEKRQSRKIAPLTVYRHLDFLTRVGLVHRIESTQSYLPCDHPEHTHESQYLLCSSCGKVDELNEEGLESLLDKVANQRGFMPKRAIVEVSGLCGECVDAG
ncbi:MAG: zinc uptake transcriptional repressor Zur [Congregibacter sp.]